jgi:AcrR family transcriptional regulator
LPSKTFFNLPQEKQDRLIQAARDELSRVPLEDASINQIIKAAGIPRGSFYMYFENKTDLINYLLDDVVNNQIDFFKEALQNEKGDVFTAYFLLIDHMLKSCAKAENLLIFKNVAIYFINNLSDPSLLPRPSIRLAGLAGEFARLVDFSRFRIERPEDIRDMADLLTAMTRDEIAELVMGRKTVSEFRASIKRKVKILKYGMLKENAAPETNVTPRCINPEESVL